MPKPEIEQQIEAKYQAIDIALGNALRSIRELHFSNKEFVKVKYALSLTLENTISELKKEVECNLNNITWDKLVIAFFGETKAGKSTIIETFNILFKPNREKDTDGIIVGDGTEDFTQDYNEYNLSVEGNPFILIDVPGIEGDETKYENKIKEALSKAHCVFYVQRGASKPQSGTAEKIKKYLGNWSVVYTIQNVVGSASKYREEKNRQNLITPEITRESQIIKNTFHHILGNVYKDNIIIQAYCAMCAYATFNPQERGRFVREQNKMLNFFGSAENVYDYSHFQILVDKVILMSKNFTKEIEKSNQQKLYALTNKIKVSTNTIFLSNHEDTDSKMEMLVNFRRSVKFLLSGLGDKISSVAKSSVRRLYNELELEIAEKLDEKNTKKKERKQNIRNLIKDFHDKLYESLLNDAQQQIQLCRNDLNTKSRKIEGVNFTNQIKLNINIDFNFNLDTLEDGLDELDINLEDIGEVSLNIVKFANAGANIGKYFPIKGKAIGTFIGASIGLLSGLGKKICFGDRGISSAKDSLKSMLEQSQKSVEEELEGSINKLKKQISFEMTSILKQIDEEIHSVEVMKSIINGLNDNVEKIAS